MQNSTLFSGESRDARCVFQSDPAFPAGLFRLSRPPKALWVAGNLPAESVKRVVIVGARDATGAACAKARDMAERLSKAGMAVLSGGAFGIDAAAHEGALAGGSPTYAVLGCGVDVVYPDRHAALFSRIGQRGGLISEFPLGTPPRARQFPSRNRILAALGEAVIVVQAAIRSGSLITAKEATAMGIPVYAVPGSAGTDMLLAGRRAYPIFRSDQVLDTLMGKSRGAERLVPDHAVHTMGTLLTVLAEGMGTPEGLSSRLGQPLSSILALLAEAELEGFVRRAGGNHYEVIGRASC